MTPPDRDPLDAMLNTLLDDIDAEYRRWNRSHAAVWTVAMATAAYIATRSGNWLLLAGVSSALGALALILNRLHYRTARRYAAALTEAMRDREPRP